MKTSGWHSLCEGPNGYTLIIPISFFSFSPSRRGDRARFRVCGPCPARKRTGMEERKKERRKKVCDRIADWTVLTYAHTHTLVAMVVRVGPVLFFFWFLFSQLFHVVDHKVK
jgi:hypothetical protein